MLHTALSLIGHLFGHLVGDPVHRVSALAIQSAIKAASALHQHQKMPALADLVDKVDSMVNSGRSVTEQEWNELKDIAERHIKDLKNVPIKPVPSDPPVAPTPENLSQYSSMEAPPAAAPPQEGQ